MPRSCNAALQPAAVAGRSRPRSAAQDYPTKPVRLIIPFPPGGSNDVVGRMIATQLSEQLGKQVIVDNRGRRRRRRRHRDRRERAEGRLHAADHLARARGQSVALQAPYDPIKSFTPIGHPRQRPERAGGQSRAAGQFGEGAGRARQAEAGRPAIRLGRRRQLPASRRRAVQARGRRRHAARAVQGRRPGDDRRDRRPHQADVLLAGADHAAHQARASCAPSATGGSKRNAGPARRADHRRGRRARPTKRSTGGASWRRPARRSRSSSRLHAAIAEVQTSPEVRSSSRPRAPRSCR